MLFRSGTHALFLRNPALRLVVWARDRENRETYLQGGLSFRNHPLAYWLAVVRHQGNPECNPVLIVQTKCDQKQDEARVFPLGPVGLADWPYSSELRLSPCTGRGMGELEEKLSDAIAWLQAPERLGRLRIGAGRLRVQRRLEALQEEDRSRPPAERRHRLLKWPDFVTLCEAEGGVSSPELLASYLDATGTVFHRPGFFDNQLVLDLSWALEAIYALFERQKVYRELHRQRGRFSRGLLGLLVWQEHSEEDQKLLLSLMQSCGMCFEHRRFAAAGPDGGDAEYLAPDLLPERARELLADEAAVQVAAAAGRVGHDHANRLDRVGLCGRRAGRRKQDREQSTFQDFLLYRAPGLVKTPGCRHGIPIPEMSCIIHEMPRRERHVPRPRP